MLYCGRHAISKTSSPTANMFITDRAQGLSTTCPSEHNKNRSICRRACHHQGSVVLARAFARLCCNGRCSRNYLCIATTLDKLRKHNGTGEALTHALRDWPSHLGAITRLKDPIDHDDASQESSGRYQAVVMAT